MYRSGAGFAFVVIYMVAIRATIRSMGSFIIVAISGKKINSARKIATIFGGMDEGMLLNLCQRLKQLDRNADNQADDQDGRREANRGPDGVYRNVDALCFPHPRQLGLLARRPVAAGDWGWGSWGDRKLRLGPVQPASTRPTTVATTAKRRDFRTEWMPR